MKTIIAALILAAGALLHGCAPMSQDELNRLAAESDSVRPLMESLARADGGDTMSIDDDRFLAEVTDRTVSRQQFISVMTRHCNAAHGGRLQTGDDSFPLGDPNIREFQLQALAGTQGPITAYLRQALGRTLNSDISKAKRTLTYDARETYDDNLHRQATVVCTSYGDSGLLRVHYLVAYLTEGELGTGDIVWAAATDAAFRDTLKRQRELALVAASRMMSDARETVVAYAGKGRNGFLTVEATLSRPAPYGYQFHVDLRLQNRSTQPLAVEPGVKQARTADGRDWSVRDEGLLREGGNRCELTSGNEVRIPPDSSCHYRFRVNIDGFEMPNMVITAMVANTFVKLSPVSEYQQRHAGHR